MQGYFVQSKDSLFPEYRGFRDRVHNRTVHLVFSNLTGIMEV